VRDEIVVVRVVSNEIEADVACGLLRTDGIKCGHRQTNITGGIGEGVSGFGPREIFVAAPDADRARALLEASD
jgi:Putative prokaryotic signal transducing protein